MIIAILLPVIESLGVDEVVLGFLLLQGLGQGDLAGHVFLNDEKSYMHPVKC